MITIRFLPLKFLPIFTPCTLRVCTGVKTNWNFYQGGKKRVKMFCKLLNLKEGVFTGVVKKG